MCRNNFTWYGYVCLSSQQVCVPLTLHREHPWFAHLYSPLCSLQEGKLYCEKSRHLICKNALYVSLPCVSQNIDEINLHLWSEWLHKYTIWGIKGPAQVKADWQQHCLVGLHFILRSPQWPQALWPWGQCQSLRMLIKWDQPAPQTQVAWLSSGESYLWTQLPSQHTHPTLPHRHQVVHSQSCTV